MPSRRTCALVAISEILVVVRPGQAGIKIDHTVYSNSTRAYILWPYQYNNTYIVIEAVLARATINKYG